MDWSEGEVLTAEDGVHGRGSKQRSHGGMADVKASFSQSVSPLHSRSLSNMVSHVLFIIYSLFSFLGVVYCMVRLCSCREIVLYVQISYKK
jgi:hypothetical protein